MKKKSKNKKLISAKEFDSKFEKGEDLSDYLNFDEAVVVRRVNIDIPQWLLDALDREALKLNVSRQAIVKMWLSEKLDEQKKAI